MDINQLCRSPGMSRSQVFRKLKALTGKSPTLHTLSIRANSYNIKQLSVALPSCQ
ncbi:MAG: hypothetical protein H6577_04365 [Lewinellaceae bacterium]|nr:hypothetical protein [Lewinellaceae bacterium]